MINPTTASQFKLQNGEGIPPSKNHKLFIMRSITKDQFIRILTDAGIGESQTHKIHALFEERHPDAHEAFLRWLGIGDRECSKIRDWAKNAIS